jgi:hypothetical protein
MLGERLQPIKGNNDKNNTTKGGINQSGKTQTSLAATKISLANQQKKSAWPSQNKSTNAAIGARAQAVNTKTQSSATATKNSSAAATKTALTNQQSGSTRSVQNQSATTTASATTTNKKNEVSPPKKNWWDSVVEGAISFGNGVAEFGNDVKETVVDSAVHMKDAVVEGASDIKESWDNNFGKNSSADRSFFDKVFDFGGKVTGEVTELAYTGGAELLSGTTQIATDGISRIAGAFSPDAANKIDNFGSMTSNFIRVAGNKYADLAGEFAHGFVAGDAIEDPTAAQLFGQVAIGFIPGVDQIADIRDTIGAAIDGDQERMDSALIGWIPEVGNIGKHSDELASVAGRGYEVLKSLNPAKLADAFKKIPSLIKNPEIFETLAKNPEIFEALAKNPEIFEALAKNPDKLAELMSDPKLFRNFIDDPQYVEKSKNLSWDDNVNYYFYFDASTKDKVILKGCVYYNNKLVNNIEGQVKVERLKSTKDYSPFSSNPARESEVPLDIRYFPNWEKATLVWAKFNVKIEDKLIPSEKKELNIEALSSDIF